MTTEPTDAEIESAWTEATGSSILPYPDDMLAFARAVLAKWGTPQPNQAVPPAWLTDEQIEAAWQELQTRRAAQEAKDFNARIGQTCSQCGAGAYRADGNGYHSFHRCDACNHVPFFMLTAKSGLHPTASASKERRRGMLIDQLEALAKRHGALSYRNRADTQNPAFGFSVAGLESLLAEVRKDDEALIRQLEIALSWSSPHADAAHGWKSENWARKRSEAITAARARLLDSDLSNLTERGAAAWAGVDAQKLREGEPHGIPPTT